MNTVSFEQARHMCELKNKTQQLKHACFCNMFEKHNYKKFNNIYDQTFSITVCETLDETHSLQISLYSYIYFLFYKIIL